MDLGFGPDAGRDPTTGRFLPGNSGLPGRPLGSHNKLAEKFKADLVAEWERRDPQVLRELKPRSWRGW